MTDWLQVVPIYGRGGSHTDPRSKQHADAQSPGSPEADEGAAVPRRPAGQRPLPVQVCPLSAVQLAVSRSSIQA